MLIRSSNFSYAINGITLTIMLVLLNACAKPAPEPAIVSTTQAPAIGIPEAKPAALETGLLVEFKQLSSEQLSIDSANSKKYLEKYFKNECSKSDERLSFEQTCQHYSVATSQEDPSPWPDLMIGIKNRKIASAVLFSAEQSLGENWQCESSKEFESMRYCYSGQTDAADRERWSKQWSAYFATAD